MKSGPSYCRSKNFKIYYCMIIVFFVLLLFLLKTGWSKYFEIFFSGLVHVHCIPKRNRCKIDLKYGFNYFIQWIIYCLIRLTSPFFCQWKIAQLIMYNPITSGIILELKVHTCITANILSPEPCKNEQKLLFWHFLQKKKHFVPHLEMKNFLSPVNITLVIFHVFNENYRNECH